MGKIEGTDKACIGLLVPFALLAILSLIWLASILSKLYYGTITISVWSGLGIITSASFLVIYAGLSLSLIRLLRKP